MSQLDETLPTGWVIPAGWTGEPQEPPSLCRSCSAQILWATTPRGKRAPLNQDGTSHFATCPQATTWRRRDQASRPAGGD